MEPIEPTSQAELEEVLPKQLMPETEAAERDSPDSHLLAMLEAVVYVADEPLSAEQIATALGEPKDKIEALLERLVAEFDKPCHGLTVRQVASGYKMTTKPEHHDGIRAFVKKLQPPLKLSLPALETLALIAYKQPITTPEIMEIRGVQGAGVIKTLLDRKLVTTAGRKNVIGRPILYKTTKEFLIQFGLKDLNELPTLKELDELRRLAMGDEEFSPPPGEASAVGETGNGNIAQPGEAEHGSPATEAAPEEDPGQS